MTQGDEAFQDRQSGKRDEKTENHGTETQDKQINFKTKLISFRFLVIFIYLPQVSRLLLQPPSPSLDGWCAASLLAAVSLR